MKACLPSNQCTVPENTKLLQDKPNSSLNDPLVPVLEEKEENKREEEEKDHTGDYYPQAPYTCPVMKKMPQPK